MSAVFRLIAARQAEQRLRAMASYVRAHNPRISEDDAMAIAIVAANRYDINTGFHPSNAEGPITRKVKELSKALSDPEAYQKWQDKREHIRNAPIDRAYRQHVREQFEKRRREEGGGDVPRGKTTDEVAREMLRNIKERFSPKRQQAPAEPEAAPAKEVHVPPAEKPATPKVAPPAQPQVNIDDEDAEEPDSFDHSQQVIKYLRSMEPRGI